MYALLFVAFLGAVCAAPSRSIKLTYPEIGVPGAFEVRIEWDVQAFPDGGVITLNGTVQDIHEQLLKINPNYDADFNLDKLDTGSKKLSARNEFSNSTVICDPKLFKKGSVYRLGQDIDYLRSLNGQPRNRGGTGACGRVSCAHGTGIWWCKESGEPSILNSSNSIADGAQMVWDRCAGRRDYGYRAGEVSGRAFHWTNWNVIVLENDCQN